MGGTTAKAGTIQDGGADYSSEYEVGGELHMGHHLLRGGGYMLRVPSIGIAEVGAGGGSILWIDDGGVLQVGPQSAGADPGPACYGAGGDLATITDANLALGYLNPEQLVGGELSIDPKAAKIAIEKDGSDGSCIRRVSSGHLSDDSCRPRRNKRKRKKPR